MTDFTIQNFYTGQEVNPDNMNGTFTSAGQQIAAFFPNIPNISSGVGTIANNFGQVGTTNQFNFQNGVFQFPQQPGPIGTTEEYTSATFNSSGTVTITVPADSATYYIVAELSTVTIDPGQYKTSVTILTPAMTLTEVETDTDIYLPICAISNTAGVYSVFLDSNCAFNYGADNTIQSDFNRKTFLGGRSNYTIALKDGFALMLNNTSYTLPNPNTLPVGFTVCIANQTGSITDGTYVITMTGIQPNYYFKCEVGDGVWIVDGQPIAYYSQWATKAYVSSYVTSVFTQSFATNGWTKLPNGFIMQWATVNIPAQTATTFSFPISFPAAARNMQATPIDFAVNNTTYRWGAVILSNTQYEVYNQSSYTISYYIWAIGY